MALVLRVTESFLPVQEQAPARSSGTAWLEPRTLAVGLMVLAFTVAEGSANDWLSLALIDGYDVAHWVGVAGYAVFVVAMWVRMVRDELRGDVGDPGTVTPARAAPYVEIDDEDDEELAAYNRRLARLNDQAR